MTLTDRAKLNFNSDYNCAESVLLALSQRIHSQSRIVQRIIPRIATGFGGGMARNGDTCGALVGGIMAIGLAFGRDNSKQSRDTCYLATNQLYRDFVKEFRSCKCRELIGVNLNTARGIQIYSKKIHYERCNPIVTWVTKRTNQIVQKHRHHRNSQSDSDWMRF